MEASVALSVILIKISVIVTLLIVIVVAGGIYRRKFQAFVPQSPEIYERYIADGVAISEALVQAKSGSIEEAEKLISDFNAWEKRVYQLTNLKLVKD